MAVFVHLADERNRKSFLENGIKIGKYRSGVYCLPVSSEFTVTHQWLRELKRRGINSMVGIYFRVPNQEELWFGKFHDTHQKATASSAIKAYLSADDKLGYEFLIPRKIQASEIISVKDLPQKMGWRYHPKSHSEKKLGCGCPMCIQRGEINGAKKRVKFQTAYKRPNFYTVVEEIKHSKSTLRLEELLWSIQGKKWKADPRLLQAIMNTEDVELIKLLCNILPQFRHPNTMKMLKEIGQSDHIEIQEAVTEAVIEIDPVNYKSLLRGIVAEELMDKVRQETLLMPH